MLRKRLFACLKAISTLAYACILEFGRSRASYQYWSTSGGSIDLEEPLAGPICDVDVTIVLVCHDKPLVGIRVGSALMRAGVVQKVLHRCVCRLATKARQNFQVQTPLLALHALTCCQCS